MRRACRRFSLQFAVAPRSVCIRTHNGWVVSMSIYRVSDSFSTLMYRRKSWVTPATTTIAVSHNKRNFASFVFSHDILAAFFFSASFLISEFVSFVNLIDFFLRFLSFSISTEVVFFFFFCLNCVWARARSLASVCIFCYRTSDDGYKFRNSQSALCMCFSHRRRWKWCGPCRLPSYDLNCTRNKNYERQTKMQNLHLTSVHGVSPLMAWVCGVLLFESVTHSDYWAKSQTKAKDRYREWKREAEKKYPSDFSTWLIKNWACDK